MGKPKYIPPVKIGDRLELSVETLASSGDGLTHCQGYALFVPPGLPGDRVLGEVVRVTPRWGVARAVERLQDSPDRIAPPCPVFPQCGGCKLQSLRYEKQMEYKVQTVVESLKRLGKLDLPEEIQTIPADRPYGYRNKGSFAAREKGGRLRIGFFEEGTHETVDSDRCDILLPIVNEIKEWVRGLLVKHRISIYDETARKGFLRGLIVRHSVLSGESLVGLVTAEGDFPAKFIEAVSAREARARFGLVGVVQNFNPRVTNVILGNVNRLLWGRDYFIDRLGDLRFRLSLGSFFQVNPYQTVRLYDLVRDWSAEGAKGGRIIDAYCGSGGIALWLARSGAEVVGVEEFPEAAGDARESASLNGLGQCEFLAGTVEEHLDRLKNLGDVQTLVLDPPRKGCSEDVVRAIADIDPERVVYVSCNPATLARDLGKLRGYAVEKLCAIDMFPQTPHVEAAVLLRKP
ncbi:MAG: 23S rRNA (uracil(1939)-C(5))-methyltransferase RlmD [Nitrospinae bacterium]|nr:23S rRNA (uracil(1939)-C(5))-methyltransferase RlmD [Nitrospinota bacterium]